MATDEVLGKEGGETSGTRHLPTPLGGFVGQHHPARPARDSSPCSGGLMTDEADYLAAVGRETETSPLRHGIAPTRQQKATNLR